MSRTPHLQLPEFGAVGVPSGAALTDGMRRLDAVVQASAISFATEPPGDVELGHRYIVASPATGDFTGQERRLAFYAQDGWHFYTPENGWAVKVGTPPVSYVYDAAQADWVLDTAGGGGGAGSVRMLGATWSRGAGQIEVPVQDVPIRASYSGRIVKLYVTTMGGPGDAQIDIWRDSTYPLNSSDSICGGTLPELDDDLIYEDETLSGWDTDVNEGDWFVFHLESSQNFNMIVVQLFIEQA